MLYRLVALASLATAAVAVTINPSLVSLIIY